MCIAIHCKLNIMSRNLYIGLGGSGIKTVDEIKQQFVNGGKEETSIATVFCGIDTDINSLHSCTSLSPNELVNIGVPYAHERFHVYPDQYDIPENNVENLKSLRNFGSGRIRSNGHFCFLCNGDKLRNMILCAYYELINIELDAVSPNIDVHMFFSLCGGTGSGIFYDIAKLVKEIIPNSNITCYAYSHNYFMDIVIPWNIPLNTYAALLELDYCFNSAYYQKPMYNPFNKFCYIDNHYFSDGAGSVVVLPPQKEVLYNEIIPNVARGVTISVKYDIPIGDIQRYNKWI